MPFVWSKQFRPVNPSPDVIEVSIPEIQVPLVISEPETPAEVVIPETPAPQLEE